MLAFVHALITSCWPVLEGQSKEIAGIWRPLQAWIIRSLEEAILVRAFFKKLLGSHYLSTKASTWRKSFKEGIESAFCWLSEHFQIVRRDYKRNSYFYRLNFFLHDRLYKNISLTQDKLISIFVPLLPQYVQFGAKWDSGKPVTHTRKCLRNPVPLSLLN